MAITDKVASKEQVAAMLQRMLNIREDEMPKYMDATDALGAAYCHFLQMGRPETGDRHYSSWKDFATKNASRIEKGTGMTGPQAKLGGYQPYHAQVAQPGNIILLSSNISIKKIRDAKDYQYSEWRNPYAGMAYG